MVPASDGGDDFIWIGGPDEGLGSVVGFLEEAVDGSLQVDDRVEDPALEAALGQFGEEAFDRISRVFFGGILSTPFLTIVIAFFMLS